MRIGITFNIKQDQPLPPGAPDDLHEEFDSPETIDAIAAVLKQLGHEPIYLGDGPALLRRLLDAPPDFVFNIAEGEGVGRSREARVPAVLEMLGIPYSGSDPLTLAAALDKDCAKKLVAASGVATPKGILIAPGNPLTGDAFRVLPFPVIVKPAWEGSSKGVRNRCYVDKPIELPALAGQMLRDYRQPIIVEEYIQGDELTVGVVGNDPPQIIGITHIVPLQQQDRFIYSLEVKRDWENKVRYDHAPIFAPAVQAAIEKTAIAAFQALGCRDLARIDFRLRDGVAYFLEANPLPGLRPGYSDLTLQAEACGVSYPRLIELILSAAFARNGLA